MAESSSDQYVGFLVPLMGDENDIWEDESSYTQDNPAPGGVAPAERSRLRLEASGTQGDTSYVLTTRRGGHISPGGAGFTWRKSTDSAGDDRGFDPPVVATGFRPVAWSLASIITRRHPDRTVLPDGSVLVCASVQTASSHDISVWRVTGDGSVTAAVDVYTQSDTPTSRVDGHLSPSVCTLDDGSIILGHVIEDSTAEEAQWRTYRSTDKGVTWTTIGTETLPDPVDIDNATGGTGFVLRRARMRHNRGYTLLVLELVASNTGYASRHAYKQYGSTADGTQFELVEAMDQAVATAGGIVAVNFGFFDATEYQGGFLVSWPTSVDEIRTARLADGYDPISGSDKFNHDPSEILATVTSGYYTDGNISVWVASDGTIYVAWRNISSGSACRLARSTRLSGASDSFTTMGEGIGSGGGSWWQGQDTGTYPSEFVGVAALGRSMMYAIAEASTTTTYEGSLFELHLGGWSNVNMPGLDLLAPATRRATWTHSGFPLELPGNTVWTKTGVSTEGLANGVLQVDVSAATGYYSLTPTCAISEALIAEFSVTMNSGTALTSGMTSGIRLAIEGVSAGYETQVRMSYAPAVLAVYDGIAGTQIGSNAAVDWDNTYEIRIEQRGSVTQVFYRVRDLASDREWTQLATTSSMTSSGGGGSNLIRWGPGHLATTSETDWYQWCYTAGDENARTSLPFTNPDDLFARDYAGLGRSVYVEGMLVTATGGPGREGESTTLSPIYDPQRGAIANALYKIASPRRTFRTPPVDPVTGNTATVSVAFQTGPSGEESYPLAEIIGAHFTGATFCTGAIQRKDTSGGWTGIDTFNLCAETSFTGTRYGQTVRPTSGTSGRWVDRDELRGGWMRMGNSSPYTWRKVAANSPGILAAPSSGLAAVIEFEGADGTEPTGAVTMAVIPPQCTVLVHTAGETAEGLRIRIDAQNCAEGAVEAGNMWIGYVVVPGQRWELGDRTATLSGSERTETRDRVDEVREVAPDRREMEIGWTALNVSAGLMGSSVDPDYALGSALSGARPVSAIGSAVGDVVGLVRRCRGALIPVVALPRVLKLSGATVKQFIWRRDEQFRGRFDGPVSVRHVTGDEGDSDDGLSYRLESVPLIEVV